MEETKSKAKALFDMIGVGKGHALRRPKDAKVDRELRILIEDANERGDYIINLGTGYYRPLKEEAPDFRSYILARESSIEKQRRKHARMTEAYTREVLNEHV